MKNFLFYYKGGERERDSGKAQIPSHDISQFPHDDIDQLRANYLKAENIFYKDETSIKVNVVITS